ncbi:MAG: GFA family protein [Bdellovibrionales bacterium]|nr:GFA family protein [Bdellovibrionales bacterium]
MKEASGKCLCGAVEFEIKIVAKEFSSCHCSMCRRWSGAPAFAIEALNGINFKNEENVKVYSSSEWAERGFCVQCGTHLFYRLKNGNYINIPLGTLNDQEDFKFTSQIFIDHKPTYYEFSNETMKMTEAEVLNSSTS